MPGVLESTTAAAQTMTRLWDAETWAAHRSSGRWLRMIRTWPESSIMRRISGPMIALLLLTSVVVILNRGMYYGANVEKAWITLPSAPLSLQAASIGLLLVFRTNQTHDRLKEAQRAVGSLGALASEIMQLLLVHVSPERYRDVGARTENLSYLPSLPVCRPHRLGIAPKSRLDRFGWMQPRLNITGSTDSPELREDHISMQPFCYSFATSRALLYFARAFLYFARKSMALLAAEPACSLAGLAARLLALYGWALKTQCRSNKDQLMPIAQAISFPPSCTRPVATAGRQIEPTVRHTQVLPMSPQPTRRACLSQVLLPRANTWLLRHERRTAAVLLRLRAVASSLKTNGALNSDGSKRPPSAPRRAHTQNALCIGVPVLCPLGSRAHLPRGLPSHSLRSTQRPALPLKCLRKPHQPLKRPRRTSSQVLHASRRASVRVAFKFVEERMSKLSAVDAVCARLSTFPVPPSYHRHASRALILWLGSLPFVLEGQPPPSRPLLAATRACRVRESAAACVRRKACALFVCTPSLACGLRLHVPAPHSSFLVSSALPPPRRSHAPAHSHPRPAPAPLFPTPQAWAVPPGKPTSASSVPLSSCWASIRRAAQMSKGAHSQDPPKRSHRACVTPSAKHPTSTRRREGGGRGRGSPFALHQGTLRWGGEGRQEPMALGRLVGQLSNPPIALAPARCPVAPLCAFACFVAQIAIEIEQPLDVLPLHAFAANMSTEVATHESNP